MSATHRENPNRHFFEKTVPGVVGTMAQRFLPWTNAEVQTFLTLVADDSIQRELDGAVRNVKV